MSEGGWLSILHGSRRWRVVIATSMSIGFLAVAVLGYTLPVMEGKLVSQFVALGVALLGLQFVVGQAGQLSLCHGVFVGIGSYATAIAISRFGWPHLVGVAFAPLMGFVAGCLVGLLALRIRATYLGPVTLSVAVVFPMIVKRFGWFTGGSSGLPVVEAMTAPGFLDLKPTEQYRWNHLVIVAVAVVAVVVVRNVVLSPVGKSVRAVSENPLSAAASGVPLRRTRIVAYGFGAAVGALGGGLVVLDTPIVGADSYNLFRSLGYYAAMMVGGASSMFGALVGAALLVGVPRLVSSFRFGSNLVLGSLLVVSTLIAPGGLIVPVRRFVSRLVTVRHSEEEEQLRRSGS